MCLQKEGGCFLNNLYKSLESLLKLQLPSECCVVFWTNESEKQDSINFVQTYQKKKEVPYMEKSREQDQKRKESPYMEMSRDND